ncbi:MAG: valine--tRNA ligase [Gemmatimonadota bacterium]|nr:MAG: valine--tRNA ligase [Gemmatimonadota bacterium]
MSDAKPVELAKAYEAAQVEDRVYQEWMDADLFRADARSDKPPFTIMIPPPNVTGVLHMGHALNNTLQDIVIRHRRMAGYEALWVPGTDHAGIATQAVVEKRLLEEGTQRKEMGREAFVAEVWKWREHHGDVILKQLRKLGCSCDWSRTKFTLDEDMSHAVRTAFVRLWEKGLVYRGARLVNWDCTLQTAVSDDEIEYVPRKGKLWYLRYPVKGEDRFVEVATTRPETMLGDTGVAVHPTDKRYGDLVGRTLVLPLMGREIPVVADESVDPEYGTGAVKVTPGHDPADYERGARHGLPIINILEPNGTLSAETGDFAGQPRYEARKNVVAALDELGLLGKIEEIEHNVALSDRSKDAIEPLVSEQWFVKMEPLAVPAIAAVKTGRLQFAPPRWEKVYLDWLENVRDWCISRQLWWGHRIPVWYDEDNVPTASVLDLEIGAPHPETGKPIVRQDEDVLDTWASSWLWPFSTLGWPERTEDLAKFYPTQFLSTAREIIYLWVARMVMAGYELLDHLPEEQRVPFSTCYINATVLDGIGRRMSKSAGNGIDPIEMIDKYGADAVRYSLTMLTREGQDTKLSENRFELGQRFCNKIWNATRFALGNLDGVPDEVPATAFEDRWILSRARATIVSVTDSLDNYHFHDGAQELYRFFWNDVCDWYLEVVKRRLADNADPADREAARATLARVLSASVRIMHPYLPFLTEELWRFLPGTSGPVMVADWPDAEAFARDEAVERDFEQMQDAVSAVRNVRSAMNVPPGKKIRLFVKAEDPDLARSLDSARELVMALARLDELTVGPDLERPAGSASAVIRGGTLYVPLEGVIDLDVERARLHKERDRLTNMIGGAEKKLANENFVSRAKPEVVANEREKLDSLRGDLEKVGAALADLG